MYDPGLSVFAGQPLYFDQMAFMYNHYTVFRSRATFNFLANQNLACTFAGFIAPDSSLPTLTYEGASEQPSAKRVTVPGAHGPGHARMVLDWDAKSAFGGDIFDNDNLQGTAAANPSEQQYFTIVAGRTGDIGQLASAILEVVIEFEAVWSELRIVPRS